MKDLMVDLETLSTRTNAAIISIGACFFDPLKGTIGNTFYREVSISSNQEINRHIDGDTILWWMNQSKGAREVFNPENKKETLKEALLSFNNYIVYNNNPEKVRLWSNSPAFDEAMLNTACLDAGVPWILKFWNTRCVRTVKGLCPDKVFQTWTKNNPREGYHNAMSDSCYQARYVSWILSNSGCEELS